MKDLKSLSVDELRVLKAFYQFRLAEAQHMLMTLDQVTGSTAIVHDVSPGHFSEENLAGVVNSKWNMFILEVLKKKGKAVTYPELEAEAMKKFRIHADKKNVLRTSLAIALTNLRRKYKVLKDFRLKGSRNKYFGMSSWFMGNEILKEYVPNPVPEKKRSSVVSSRKTKRKTKKKYSK